MNDKDKKLKQLEELSEQMQDEFVEKAKQGDSNAMGRAGEMALLKYMAEKSRTCQHTYEWTTIGGESVHVCTKCGLWDPDAQSIEEKWADAWS